MTVPGQQERHAWRSSQRDEHIADRSDVRTIRPATAGQPTGPTEEGVFRNTTDVAVRHDADIADLVVQIRHRHPGNVDVHRSLLRDQGRPGYEAEHDERCRSGVGHSVTPEPPAPAHIRRRRVSRRNLMRRTLIFRAVSSSACPSCPLPTLPSSVPLSVSVSSRRGGSVSVSCHEGTAREQTSGRSGCFSAGWSSPTGQAGSVGRAGRHPGHRPGQCPAAPSSARSARR